MPATKSSGNRLGKHSRNSYRSRYVCGYAAILVFGLSFLSLHRGTACDRGINVGCYHKSSHKSMSIEEPTESVDMCISSCEKLYQKYAVLDGTACSCTNTLSVDMVDPSKCNRPCPNHVQQYCGGDDDVESYYDTDINVAGPVTNVQFRNVSDTRMSIAWQPPESVSLLDRYMVRAQVLQTFSVETLLNPEWTVGAEERQFDLVDLHPGTKYNITIISLGMNGIIGGSIALEQWTEVGEPDEEPAEPKILAVNRATQIVEIYPVTNNNGPVSRYQLVVIFINYGLLQKFETALLKDYNASREDGTQYYIAAELESIGNNTRRILIGDGKTYNGYYNAPLPPNSHIHVAIGVVSTLNGVTKTRYGTSSHEQHDHLDLFELDGAGNSVMIVVLSILCVILALLLIASVAMFVYLRRRVKSPRRRLTEQHEMSMHNGSGTHEMENNGFIGDELDAGTFQQQLRTIFDRIPQHQKLPRNTLSLDIDNILGTGRFGDVIHGNLHTNTEAGINSQIHIISDDMERPDQVLFLKELDQLVRVSPNPLFMPFLGVCTTADWLYVIFEDTGMTLKRRLVDSRLSLNVDQKRMTSLSEEFVVRIMSNIADAMAFLTKMQIVHKQLCSYNVRMTANDEPKLSIFGPTLYIEDRKLVDLGRYQAPEVLRHQHHTAKSDVWSFACFAWECCTAGGTLYSNIISTDLLARIRNGARPEQTPFIYNDLYQLLLNCWELDPVDRLDFKDVAEALKQMLRTSPKHVLSFDRHDGLTLPYYLPLLEVKIFD